MNNFLIFFYLGSIAMTILCPKLLLVVSNNLGTDENCTFLFYYFLILKCKNVIFKYLKCRGEEGLHGYIEMKTITIAIPQKNS